MSRLPPLVAALALLGCSEVPFDFGVPVPDEDAGVCPAVGPDPVACENDAAPCSGTVSVFAQPVSRAAGCTPAGLPVGAARFDLPGAGNDVDLLAWAEPLDGSNLPFRKGASLALFGDECGDALLGGTLDCDYRPWLLVQGLAAGTPAFVHAQGEEAGILSLGFEIRPAGTWSRPLPAAGEPLACDGPGPGYDGDLEDPLVSVNPWTAPVDLDLSRAAPSAGRDPWICGAGADGWRQAGFVLHNPYDAAIVMRGARLVRKGDPDSAPLFHFALAACSAKGPSPIVASSCADPGDDPSKNLEAGLVPWVPGDPGTEYALVLQVPPSEGASFTLTLEADPGP
ncbi:MAG: hypothetical protein PHU25_05770 [Deltaproteobacteria bacterium]|nr:hypothetical protein [Deltaproteobacteria bacterium]